MRSAGAADDDGRRSFRAAPAVDVGAVFDRFGLGEASSASRASIITATSSVSFLSALAPAAKALGCGPVREAGRMECDIPGLMLSRLKKVPR